MTNFEFLSSIPDYTLFSAAAVEAEKVYSTSPAMCAVGCRKALELAVKWVYSADNTISMPYKENLQSLIHEPSFRFALDNRTWGKLPFIIKLGNLSVHTERVVNNADALLALESLFEFIEWLDYCYGSDYVERHFDPALIPTEKVIIDTKKIKEQESLIEQKDSEIKALQAKIAEMSAALTAGKEEKQESRSFAPADLSEFKTRKIYIDVVNDCITPRFIVNNTYIDSSSAIVQRLYSLEDENKLSVALGKVIKRGVILNTLSKNGFIETGDFVNKWLGEFKIADKIRIEGTEEGIGIKVFIVKGKEKRLLADEGYGITQLASLFIQIENNIIENTRVRYEKVHTGISSYIKDSCHYQPSYITIEEPENHLHPKYQSLLADMFVEAYQVYNIHFIIETHSEYLIRKLQVLVADKENELTPNDVSLNYVEKDDGGISHNRQIKIQEDGRLSEPFGPGFFDESKTLVMQMLKF